MNAEFRPADPCDWPAILQVAHQAVPDAKLENEEWWQNRQDFDTSRLRRRHYVAEDPETGQILAYGAIEEGPKANMYRLFVVMDPSLLEKGLAEQCYARLQGDLTELEAEIAWVREEIRDPIVSFFRGRGFEERSRFMLSNGREAIVLGRRL